MGDRGGNETRARRWALALLLAASGAMTSRSADAQDEAATSPASPASPASPSRALTLGRALALGRQAAPNVKVARARALGAEAEVARSRAGYLPSANASAGGSYSLQAGSVSFGPVTQRIVMETRMVEGSLGVGWTLFDFGKTGSGVEAAEALSDGSGHVVVDESRKATREIARAYVTALREADVVHAGILTVAQRERHAAIARALAASGIRPAVELARARLAVDTARLELEAAQVRKAVARTRLAAILGLDPLTELALSELPLYRLEDDPRRAASAAEHRPELAIAAADLAAAEAKVDQARSGWLPTVRVQADARYRVAERNPNTLFLPNRDASAGLTITMPLFDATLRPRLDAAKAVAVEAQATLDAQRISVKAEASVAALEVRSGRRLLADSEHIVEEAAAVLKATESRFAAGLSSSFELEGAEGADASARTAAVRARLRLDLATVDLLAATHRLDVLASGGDTERRTP